MDFCSSLPLPVTLPEIYSYLVQFRITFADRLFTDRRIANSSLRSQKAWIENGFTFCPLILPSFCKTVVAFASASSWNLAKSVDYCQ